MCFYRFDREHVEYLQSEFSGKAYSRFAYDSKHWLDVGAWGSSEAVHGIASFEAGSRDVSVSRRIATTAWEVR